MFAKGGCKNSTRGSGETLEPELLFLRSGYVSKQIRVRMGMIEIGNCSSHQKYLENGLIYETAQSYKQQETVMVRFEENLRVFQPFFWILRRMVSFGEGHVAGCQGCAVVHWKLWRLPVQQ